MLCRKAASRFQNSSEKSQLPLRRRLAPQENRQAMNSKNPFFGQSILITGASSGLGAEFARQLVIQGAHVALIARRLELLQDLQRSLADSGQKIAIATADVGQCDEMQSAVAQLAKEMQLQAFDRVILNAGVGITFRAQAFDAQKLEEVTRINYLGAANTIAATLPAMIKTGKGHIVGISSLSARRGLPVGFAYGASKAALTTMLEGMRVELRSAGIDISVIHPGFIRTPMIADQDTPQPGLLEPDFAVRLMLNAIAKRKKQCNFPFQTTFLTEALRRLPVGLSDFLVDRFVLRSIEKAENQAK
jgi:short-subunit dehydrogenase